VFVDQQKEVIFTVYAKSPSTKVTLISLSGKRYTDKSRTYTSHGGSDLFAGMYVHSYVIPQGEVGAWKVVLQSTCKDAYLLTTSFLGNPRCKMELPSVIEGNKVPVSLKATCEMPDPKEVMLKIVHPDKTFTEKRVQFLLQNGKYKAVIKVGDAPGLYNLSFEIKTSRNGQEVVRTVTHSLYKK
jgi:hypothetical protein